MLEDWETVSDALLRQPEEKLCDAAQRVLRRAQRFGKITERTMVANMVVNMSGESAWRRIHKAAEFWRHRT